MTVKIPTMIKKFITKNKYSRPGSKRSKTTKIAWHFTGQHDVSAKNTVSYFSNVVANGYKVNGKYIYASSHFVCGLEGEIYYIVPMEEIAYTTNSANYYSIGIECATTGTDDHYSDEEYVSMVKLGAWLAQYYGLDPRTDFIRHYDVTKKVCPRYFVNNSKKWEQFKLDCYNYMKGKLTEKNIRNCTNGKGNSIISSSSTTTTQPSVKETTCNKIGYTNVPNSSLNVRKGPGSSYNKLGSLKDNVEVEIVATCDNGWYKIKYNNDYGYVSQSYIDGIKNATKKIIKNISKTAISVRKTADWDAKAITQLQSGASLTYADGPLEAKNGSTKMYKTISGTYVTASSKYVSIIEIKS